MIESLEKFNTFLKSVDLEDYRKRFLPVKIVEMNMPPNAQAIDLMYIIYGTEKRFISFDDFYKEYLLKLKKEIEEFRIKTTMCKDCFYRGLPARIYRTWASIITQIHAGYVAESVFGKGTISMSEKLDHSGADFQITYKGRILNYQVKKKTFSGEVRKGKGGVKKPIAGEFIDISYIVPNRSIFESPKTLKGEFRKPYIDFIKNTSLARLPNGFIVFTRELFEEKKKEIDALLK